MARNLSRRRVLTHNDFMRFAGLEPAKSKRPRGKLPTKAEARRVMFGSRSAPVSQAKIAREVDALIYACPDGARCCDAECIAENARRRRDRKGLRHHESKPERPSSKRWSHKDVARSSGNVDEAVVRRIYAAVQTAKKQGLHGGYLVDLLEREVGRKLYGGEHTVAWRAKMHLAYNPPGGYQGPKPIGSAQEPPRPHSCDRRMREATRIRDRAERVINDVMSRTSRIGTNEDRCRERLRQAADELDVAADLYEEAGARVTAGTLHERARQARHGEYRKLSIYE